MSKDIADMCLKELEDYNQTLCINHFTDRLDFPTNNNEAERKWYSQQFKMIKERRKQLKEEK